MSFSEVETNHLHVCLLVIQALNHVLWSIVWHPGKNGLLSRKGGAGAELFLDLVELCALAWLFETTRA